MKSNTFTTSCYERHVNAPRRSGITAYRVPIQEETVNHDPLDIFPLGSMFFFYLLKTRLPLLKDGIIYGYILLFVEVVVRHMLRRDNAGPLDLRGISSRSS